jgi:predicted RNA-binding Zn-ribbon protein involved in translation (DUF1610 family)
MRNLKEIAIELLDKYEDSEMGCISEGISTLYDMNELEDECKWYREEIEAAANAAETKHGKWIVHYECPKCGEITKNFMEYCPFCGADMREKTKDEHWA